MIRDDNVAIMIEKLTNELSFASISMKVEVLQSFRRESQPGNLVESRIEVWVPIGDGTSSGDQWVPAERLRCESLAGVKS